MTAQLDQQISPLDYLSSPEHQGEQASWDLNPVNVFVSPDADLVAKPGWGSDSWFVTSHLQTADGPLDLLVHFMHLEEAAGPGVVQAMASVLHQGSYASEEQDFPNDRCSLSTEKFEVITPIASLNGQDGRVRVQGEWPKAGISCDLTLTQSGPMLANAGNGLWPMLGGLTYHYALPTMASTGTVTIDGRRLDVTGSSWLDRQWATTRLFGAVAPRWVWFGICLDDGTRLSCWDVIEQDRRHTFATVLAPSGSHELVSLEPTVELASKPWTSTQTGRVYPTRWVARMSQIDGELIIEPDVLDQEFVSANPALHKYEATARVTGHLHGKPAAGYATIELVGGWTS